MANYTLRIGFSSGYQLAANVGSYTLTGVDALLTYTSGSSAITSSVLTNRTSGTAPLYVHFDASGTTSSDTSITSAANGAAFRNIRHSFDFGDTSAGTWSGTGNSRNTHSGGSITAHVFETPGTYTVNVTHSHTGTSDKLATPIVITVADPNVTFAGTLTICVNNAGTNDGQGPSGCTYVSSASLVSVTNNRRYLFKKGEVHDLPGGSWNGVYVDSYGASGAAPIISLNGIQNLGTTGGNVIRNCNIRGFMQWARGSNNLLARSSVYQSSTASGLLQTQEDGFSISKYTCFFEVDLDDATATANYSAYLGYAAWVALLGVSTNRAIQHNIRIPNFYKTCIQNCYIKAAATNDGSKHCIKAHAQSSGSSPVLWNEVATGNFASEKLVISNNILGSTTTPYAWTVATDPQNNSGSQPEGVQDVINENNIYWRGTNGSPTDVVEGGRRITTRGNTSANATFLVSSSVNSLNIPSGWDGPYFST